MNFTTKTIKYWFVIQILLLRIAKRDDVQIGEGISVGVYRKRARGWKGIKMENERKEKEGKNEQK